VSVVASPIANGTLRMRASVLASSVLPEPVGPISRTLDLSISTSSVVRELAATAAAASVGASSVLRRL
jgi:hypothetical protein